MLRPDLTNRNATLLSSPKARYSPIHYVRPKKPRLHATRSTSRLWVKRLSSSSPMHLRIFQENTFNEEETTDKHDFGEQ